MRTFIVTMLFAAFVLLLVQFVHSAEEPPQREAWNGFMQSARTKFPGLTEEYGREFQELFRDLTAAASLGRFFEAQEDTREGRLYREFLLQSIDNSLRGGVGEAMFEALALSVTPPGTVLKAIAPELGPDGRLHGLLQQPSNNVFRHIQKQAPQGYPGRASFDLYVAFLRHARERGTGHRANAELLVAHMFNTDLQEGFLAMLRVEYGLEAESNRVYGPVASQSREELRHLQLIQHEVADYLFRQRYSFTQPGGLKHRVESHLRETSGHTKWWVRLYVAEILRQHAEFRQPEIVARLVDDGHPFVREAMQFAREPRKERAKRPVEKPGKKRGRH